MRARRDPLRMPGLRRSSGVIDNTIASRCLRRRGSVAFTCLSTFVLTPGSMYPYAPILFDYVRRTMPMTAPQSLTNDQVYALAAYLLNLNGLVPDTAVMDAESLTKVMMPNRNGFIPDDRPDTSARRCMTNC